MHEKLQETTIETLKTARLWTAVGGSALIGADILAGPELNGLKYIGIGGLLFASLSGTLIKHEKDMSEAHPTEDLE